MARSSSKMMRIGIQIQTPEFINPLDPRSAFDGFIYFSGFYLQMSLSHGYLLRIRINQVREVSIVYCQWTVIAYSVPFH